MCAKSSILSHLYVLRTMDIVDEKTTLSRTTILACGLMLGELAGGGLGEPSGAGTTALPLEIE